MAIINFVKNYERIARFKWGNYEGMKGPGPVFVIPIMNSAKKVDLRTEVMDIPRQRNITKDNAAIDIDFLVYLRVMDEYADRAVLVVENYRSAVVGLATTTLRAVVGDITLDQVLSQRERINALLREKLDFETERWGIKVENVHPDGRRCPAGGDPNRRGRPAGRGPARRRVCDGPGEDLQRCPEHRRQHPQPPVLRDAQGVGERRSDQVHIPDGVHQPAQPVHKDGRSGQRRGRLE